MVEGANHPDYESELVHLDGPFPVRGVLQTCNRTSNVEPNASKLMAILQLIRLVERGDLWRIVEVSTRPGSSRRLTRCGLGARATGHKSP